MPIETSWFDEWKPGELEGRITGVLSWLQFRPNTLAREIMDLYAEGIHDQHASRAFTQVVLELLEERGMIRRTPSPLAEGGDQAVYSLRDDDRVPVYLRTGQPELTPRERSFLGALANGRTLTASELEGSIPFAVGDAHETNEPWRTAACLGHLVALAKIQEIEANGYRLLVE